MQVDVVDGLLEFRRNDAGDISFVERNPVGGRPDIVIVPSAVWQRVWPRLISMAELRAVTGD